MFSDSFFYLVDQIKDSSVLRCRTIVEWLPYVLLCAAHDGGRDSSVFEAGTLMRGSDTLEKFSFASGMTME
jgi:hypothetical protein